MSDPPVTSVGRPSSVTPLPRGGLDDLVDQSLLPSYITSPIQTAAPSNPSSRSTGTNRGRLSSISATLQPNNLRVVPELPSTLQDATYNVAAAPVTVPPISATHRARRASAAEKALEQLRSRSDLQKSSNVAASGHLSTPRTSWINFQQKDEALPGSQAAAAAPHNMATGTQSRRQSLLTPTGPPPSPILSKATVAPPASSSTSAAITMRPRPTWPISTPALNGVHARPFPPELLGLLDGEHHTDELAVRFEAGWPVLESWLVAAGGGKGDGEFGRVCIIYQ